MSDDDAPDVLPWRRRPARDASSFLSPRARGLVAGGDVDVATVQGTGTGGRVTAADVLAATTARSHRVPFNRIRQRSAPALLASKRTSAHAFTSIGCDYSSVELARRAVRAEWRAREGWSLTYLPFVARAITLALAEHRACNATLGDGDELVLHAAVNLGIAVDLDDEGLVVPVVRDAHTKSVADLARAIVDVAERARARRLVPDDLAAGTFTVTNPGGYGTYLSVPIINQPQVAIVATDGVAKRVVAKGAGVTTRPLGNLGLSFDRRAVSAAEAAAFLEHLRAVLEQADWSAEL